MATTSPFNSTLFTYTDGELQGIVNSIYGHDAVGGWLLSCISLLIFLTLRSDEDAINNDFPVAFTYPVVASSDLLFSITKYWKLWRILKSWLGMHFSVQNHIVGNIDIWKQWLLVSFGPALAEQFGAGVGPDEMPLEVIALPYLAHASMQVMNLSLPFFGLYFIFIRQLHPADHRRSGTALAVAWFMSIVSWWHISGTRRDYSPLVDLSCLIPYTRSLWRKATVRIALTVDTPELAFSVYKIPIRVSDFAIIFLLLI
jgi:hypothetical protein